MPLRVLKSPWSRELEDAVDAGREQRRNLTGFGKISDFGKVSDRRIAPRRRLSDVAARTRPETPRQV